MNLSKASIKGLGVLVSGIIVVSTGLVVINPLIESRSISVSELESLRTITESKKLNLSRLQAGVVNFDKAFETGENYTKIVPKGKDIESASRAISTALVAGVEIKSFTFNSEEPVANLELPKPSLDPYAPPASFSKDDSGASSGTSKTEGASKNLNRLPMIITVSATNYQTLSEYITQLSKEDRLVSVVSVSASGKDGVIKGDIYAYAFIDKS